MPSTRQWHVEFHGDCESWAKTLEQEDQEDLLAAIQILRDRGPSLGRPLVDTVQKTKVKNLKELRPGSSGRSEIRVLFAFDLKRQAILLVGGDKSGNWRGWYPENIPIAETRFEEHQARLKNAECKTTTKTKSEKKKGAKSNESKRLGK